MDLVYRDEGRIGLIDTPLEQRDGAVYTTSQGAPVQEPYAAQRAGPNGPLLLQDFHLIDLLSHFDRERIP